MTQYREPTTGRIQKGGRQPAAVKRKISASQARRHAAAREAMPYLTSGTKRCSQCKEVKPWDSESPDRSDFPIRSRKLADDTRVRYPAGECKTCNAARSAAYRDKLRADGTYSARLKEWNERRDKEHRRRYQREYQRGQRRALGIPERGPWKRYRDEPGTLVPTQPFADWLARWLLREDLPTAALDVRAGQRPGKLRDSLKRVFIELELVDEYLYAAGSEGMLAQLYPLNG